MVWLGGWVGGWMGGWVGGWVGGWLWGYVRSQGHAPGPTRRFLSTSNVSSRLFLSFAALAKEVGGHLEEEEEEEEDRPPTERERKWMNRGRGTCRRDFFGGWEQEGSVL